MKRSLALAAGPPLATLAGLIVVLAVGSFSWSLVRGVSGIAIGTVVALVVGWLLRFWKRWPISLFASGAGAVVACFFTISSAESLPPGSLEWALKGGLYGACFGIPVAFGLSPVRLLRREPVRVKSDDVPAPPDPLP